MPEMNLGPWFAWSMVGLSIGASIAYAVAGDARRAIYWAASAVLIASVTW